MTSEPILRPAPLTPLDRMGELHRRLTAGETLGKSAVAVELGVDARTIQRDLARLRELGAPVIYDRLAMGHRYTHSRWRFDPNHIVPDEPHAAASVWTSILAAPGHDAAQSAACGAVSLRLAASEGRHIDAADAREDLVVERHGDGSATVHLQAAAPDAVRRLVLELEGRAEVVAPACLRDTVVEAAVAVLRRHERDPAA